jgi:hypothetical protein
VEPLDPRNDTEKAAIAKTLDVMWAKFLPDIRERVNVLDMAAEAAAAGTLTEELRAAGQSAAHKLAGTLGTFGLGPGSELAREMEERFLRGGITSLDAFPFQQAAAKIRRLIELR